MKRTGIFTAAALAALGATAPALAQQGEIRIGEINSYSGLPAFTEPYRKGWQLAVDEVNAAGRRPRQEARRDLQR
jgi:branched-chain amino acid transport system substrate-binding protein